MGFITRGAKNAFRNTIRTVSIVAILALVTGLALTMLLARQAVQTKIESVKSSIGNTINIAPAGAQGFEGGGEPLTVDQLASVARQAHVVSVTETLRDRLSSDNSSLVSSIEAGTLGRRFRGGNDGAIKIQGGAAGNGTFTPPVEATGTSDASTVSGAAIKLTSGANIDAGSNDNVALIGADLATKNNLQVGSAFTAYNATITVKGIFDTGTKFANNAVIFPLATLQRLSDQPGQISAATVQVDSISNLASATAAIKSALGDKADVTNQQDTSSEALAPLENIKGITLFSLIGAVAAGAVIIFLTMLMIVRERRREIGVFKAIGASNAKITTQFVSEATVLTLLGSVVGVLGGALLSNSMVSLLVSSNTSAETGRGVRQLAGGGGRMITSFGGPGGGFGRGFQSTLQNIHATVGYEIILYGLLGAVIIAIIGSAIPAFLISKVRPAEVMRGE